MENFTVFIQENSGIGTTHIQSYEAKSIEQAKQKALEQVSLNWGYDIDVLHILGVVRGNIVIVEWNDLVD